MAQGRPRGFIDDWNPRSDTRAMISMVHDILTDEAEYLPLTIRQIFYRIVSRHKSKQVDGFEFDKTQKSYKRLCENLNRARRAQWINMDDIRDDELTERGGGGWHTMAGFLNYVKQQGSVFHLNRQLSQPRKIFVWCEAAGMVPQLVKAVDEWDIPVFSSGGFDSLTTKHNFAYDMADHDHAIIFHLGDHDPSGVHMFGSLDEDVREFWEHYADGGYGRTLDFRRLAVTPDQIMEMNLQTAPPKPTDNRSFRGETTQCEAIPPGELNRILRSAVSDEIDWDEINKTVAREEEIREELTKKFKNL